RSLPHLRHRERNNVIRHSLIQRGRARAAVARLTSGSDAYRCHHSSGHSLFRSVAEENLRMARRAWGGRVDVVRGHTRIQQLPAVRLYQIEKKFYRQLSISGGARGQEEQWIFLPHRVRLLHLAEQTATVGKLSRKAGTHFFAHLVTATLHSGANRGDQVTRIALEVLAHFANALLDDTLDRAAPAGVKNTDSPPFPIHQNDGEAIGSQYG